MERIGEGKFKSVEERVKGCESRRDGRVESPAMVGDGGVRAGSMKVVGRANGVGGR